MSVAGRHTSFKPSTNKEVSQSSYGDSRLGEAVSFKQ